jgi:carbamoyl-phosphate synthase small subunit
LKKGILVANKYIYEGNIIGNVDVPIGFELCFNTSMTGYQEIITDPSYFGQVIVFTSTHIGNVGCNGIDIESNRNIKGIIVKEKPSEASSWRSEIDFEEYFIKNNIFCLYGVDTRSLVEKIRKKEISTGVIGNNLDELLKIDQSQYDTNGQDLASLTCGEKIRKISGEKNSIKLAVIDCGIKNNILNCLQQQGFDLIVYPCNAIKSYMDDIKKADGLCLSNGPGDPRATLENIPQIRELIDYFSINDRAILGICLGHQILSLFFGINVEKMSQGHRGGNQPVIDTVNNTVHITSQNHGFSATKTNLATEKYVSLFDNIIEGFIFSNRKIISVQYHPESSPGPRDSRYIFQDFKKLFIN